MKAWNKAWVGALGTLVLLSAGGAAVLYSGVLDVSAATPHTPIVYRLLETARERAIARRIGEIAPPADLNYAERRRRGAGNYAAMCADCHLAPGMADSEIRAGLYPQPPDLARAEAAGYARGAARQFWIIKHGIKASGMPAWGKSGMEDGAIWDLVAFLRQMPALSPEQYKSLVAASDGHSHAGAPHDKPAPAGKRGGHGHHGHAH